MVCCCYSLSITFIGLHLRSHQIDGIDWLIKCCRTATHGAILADEMGLGKTCQAVMLLKMIRSSRHHLVLCPLSVLDHWNSELQRWVIDVELVEIKCF